MSQAGGLRNEVVELRTNALLRLGEDLFPDQDREMTGVCVHAMTAGSNAALVCDAQWHTVVARYNTLVHA